jgi:hypothetical protein
MVSKAALFFISLQELTALFTCYGSLIFTPTAPPYCPPLDTLSLANRSELERIFFCALSLHIPLPLTHTLLSQGKKKKKKKESKHVPECDIASAFSIFFCLHSLAMNANMKLTSWLVLLNSCYFSRLGWQ